MSGLYAIRIGGEWYLARAVKASRYGEPRKDGANIPANALVWSEHRTTSWLGKKGDEEALVLIAQ